MGAMPVTAYVVVLAGTYSVPSRRLYRDPHEQARESWHHLATGDRHTLTIGGILNFFVAMPGQPMWFVVIALLIFVPSRYSGTICIPQLEAGSNRMEAFEPEPVACREG